ncbi:glycosyltransferase [Biformimicrobium ophioploci]|uniref:glycosyltransferase n=1 Tax=Biformimicrobium ophioploci TaxID=3036711 RepID=UPI002556667D|nr:glycosyltransferase [Microbulbifer sp. NKW57]
MTSFDSDLGAALHFIFWGGRKGLSPSPFFDSEYYLKMREGEETFAPAFFDWMKHSHQDGVCCIRFFDSKFYQNKYADLANYPCQLYLHFILHGVLEGRQPNQFLSRDLLVRILGKQWESHAFSELIEVALRNSCDSRIQRALYLNGEPETAFEFDRLSSGVLLDIIYKASQIQPLIKAFGPKNLVVPNAAHEADGRYVQSSHLASLLKDKRYTIVVAMPHCRDSGAARVASWLVKALANALPADQILIVRTELPDFEHPDWFPDSVANLDLSSCFAGLKSGEAESLLVEMLRGVDCKIFFNVNSLVSWQAISVFGSQLSSTMNLVSYLFCYDRDLYGNRVGYPAQFFDQTVDYHEAIFVDSEYLRSRLLTPIFARSPITRKVIVLNTPVDRPARVWHRPDDSTVGLSRKKNIFWAGRFDRQKRFDLLCEIANLMPYHNFKVWGREVLGGASIPDKIPDNVECFGPYENFGDLPIFDCDLWLYTSEWDGVPTLLLDVMAAGVPIVMTKVEGTSDLAASGYCYNASPDSGAGEYQRIIDHVFSNYDTAVNFAEKQRQYVEARHSFQGYQSEITKTLSAASFD